MEAHALVSRYLTDRALCCSINLDLKIDLLGFGFLLLYAVRVVLIIRHQMEEGFVFKNKG
jgi:hypothetical protein